MNDDKNPNHPDESNQAVMEAIRSQRWLGRGLAGLALALGLLAIFASIVLAWANAIMIQPMQRRLLEDYPRLAQQSGTNVEGIVAMSREEIDWHQIQVSAAHGKVMFLTAMSVGLLAAGTLVTLLLVVFNRRVTLGQINASLAQISRQIQTLQGGGSESK